MNRTKTAVLTAVLMMAVFGTSWALADRYHSHVHFGVVIGGPGYWYPPPYYYPHYYYSPSVVAVPVEPPTNIERDAGQGDEDGYWYYCSEAKVYYPYVKDCPGGW